MSVHGANRLGSNSLSHCVIWGRITGRRPRAAPGARSFPRRTDVRGADRAAAAGWTSFAPGTARKTRTSFGASCGRPWTPTCTSTATGGAGESAAKLAELAQARYPVFRSGRQGRIQHGASGRAGDRQHDRAGADRGGGALQRKETRGSHAMVEYPTRDDANFLAPHTRLPDRRERRGYPTPRWQSRDGSRWKGNTDATKEGEGPSGAAARIGRLARFYFEGYLHVLVYRIQVPLTILCAPPDHCVPAWRGGLGTGA